MSVLLSVASVSRSSFYYQLSVTKQKERWADEKQKIRAVFVRHKGRYGYRRITLTLQREGVVINHKTVLRLMQQEGLACRLRHKKYQSYRGAYGKAAPNLLNRNFDAESPNQKWVTDVTEFRLGDRKLYLSPIMDLYNREIIAWDMDEHPTVRMTEKMLDIAFSRLSENDKPVLHSDQGWQYQMPRYRKRLEARQISQSMSRKGNCLDNAVIENFFGLLKSECWHGEKYGSTRELRAAVERYIDYYNHDRIKEKLNGLSPVEYRIQAMQAKV